MRRYLCRFMILACVGGLIGTSTTSAEDYSKWQHFKTIQFNTSPNGADVSGDVQNYPLAIALSGSNFDFAQTKPDGSDLRISADKDSPALPCSIEHWDQAGKSALVWIKVPTVRGNSTNQSLYLHFGNAAAASVSDSKKVFDTNDGFVGVWHLDEEGNSQEEGYRDATANAAHGTGVNLSAGSRVDARVGKGLLLKYPEKQWVKVASEKRKLFDLTNKLTFSIWAKAHSYSNVGDQQTRSLPGYETMFAKGDNSWRLQKFGIKSWHKPPAELLEICVERKEPRGDLCVVCKTDMVVNQWFHFVGVHDHPRAKVYINGVLDKIDTFDTEWKTDDHPVGIGNQSQFPDRGRQWDGVLDEARMMNVVKDDHWIKLDYESQREGQKLLTLGPTQRR